MFIKREKNGATAWAVALGKAGHVDKWTAVKADATDFNAEQSALAIAHYKCCCRDHIGTISFLDADGKPISPTIVGTVPPSRVEPEPTLADLKRALGFQKERADKAVAETANWKQDVKEIEADYKELESSLAKASDACADADRLAREQVRAEMQAEFDAHQVKKIDAVRAEMQAEIDKLKADLKASEDLAKEAASVKKPAEITATTFVQPDQHKATSHPDKSTAGPSVKK